MSKLQNRLTYANVTSTLALVIAVAGGTAYAANTIGSDDVIDESLLSQDIKNNEVGSADLTNNAIRSSDVRSESLTGADIQENTLAKVPDADQLDGLSSEAFKVGCPSAWVPLAGLCFEDPDASGYTLPQAVNRCRQLGGRLPTYTELFALAKSGITLSSPMLGDWTGSSAGNDQTIYIDAATSDNMDGVRANTETGYVRCVKTPVNALGFP